MNRTHQKWDGILGYTAGSMGDTDFIKCTVANSQIINNNAGSNMTMVSGICSMSESTVMNFVDCNVTNSKIKSESGRSAGMLCYNGQSSYSNPNGGINLENCKVYNTPIKSNGSNASDAGGLISQVSSLKTTINNCVVTSSKEDNNEVEGYDGTTDEDGDTIYEITSGFNAGGLIGTMGTNVDITNSEVSNMAIKNSGGSLRCTGGIVALGLGKSTINNVKVSNLELEGKDAIGGIWGVETSQAELNNSQIENITIRDVSTSNSGMLGGVGGYVSNLKMKEGTLDNIQITCNELMSPVHTAGVTAVGTIDASDIDINKVKIENRSSQGSVGGIVSIAPSSSKLENINMTNSKLSGKLYIGGMMAIATSPTEINANDGEINISDIEINGNGITSQMMVSTAFANTNGNIKNVNVKNGKINVTSQNTQNCTIGGILANHSGSTIDNCSVDSLDIGFKSNANDTPAMIGGISATCNNVSNTNANDITIKSDTMLSHISGGIADAYGKVDNVNISNVDITSINKEKSNSYVGGIVGCVSSSYNIENSHIENSNIYTKNSKYVGGATGICTAGRIKNTSVTSITIENDTTGSGTGGIVGVAGNPSSEINDCTLTESSIQNGANECTKDSSTGIEIYSGGTGGILGIGNCSINKCNVDKSSIISNEEASYGVGGIIGHGCNIKNNATSVDGCNVNDTYIEGTTAVGGIAGAAVPTITECTIEGDQYPVLTKQAVDEENEPKELELLQDTSVQEAEMYTTMIVGEDEVGGIIGFGGVLTKLPKVERLFVTTQDCTIQDIKVSGEANVNASIGKHSYEYDDEECTPKDQENGFKNERGYVEIIDPTQKETDQEVNP